MVAEHDVTCLIGSRAHRVVALAARDKVARTAGGYHVIAADRWIGRVHEPDDTPIINHVELEHAVVAKSKVRVRSANDGVVPRSGNELVL